MGDAPLEVPVGRRPAPASIPHTEVGWRRRVNSRLVYGAMRRAIRDCNVKGPILMAPCSYGWYFQRFRRDNIEVVGLDISPKMIERARAAVTPPMQVIEGNILQMDFADGQFEFVLTNRFLMHFKTDFRVRAMKELTRVTHKYLLMHYDVPSQHTFLRKVRGFQKKDFTSEELQGWRINKRQNRRLIYTPEMMADEGASVGLVVKKIYHVFPLLASRVYCLYEKRSAT